MAKKMSLKTSKQKMPQPKMSATLHYQDYRDIIKEMLMSPVFKYIAGGITAAILARLANQSEEKFPEISSFIKDNMNMLQNKLDEYKGHLQGHDSHVQH
jgi:hypothetical protein